MAFTEELKDQVSQSDKLKCRDYYEIRTDGLAKFGCWIVNDDGDVVNAERDYSVFEDQVKISGTDSTLLDWLCHLRAKEWFNKDCEHDFVTAFCYALYVKNKK